MWHRPSRETGVFVKALLHRTHFSVVNQARIITYVLLQIRKCRHYCDSVISHKGSLLG